MAAPGSEIRDPQSSVTATDTGGDNGALDPLLAPRSIALLGASTVHNRFGHALFDMATTGGYRGEVYPVNPKYREAGGYRFYPDLDALPDPAEHVVLAVPNDRLERCFTDAVEHGARAVTIFADGRGRTESGEPPGQRIRTLAEEHGILVCGPGSMGFHNLDIGLRVTPFPAPKGLVAGGIAAVFQSGSVMGALTHNDQRLRFNVFVSSGSECTVTAADYLHWMLGQPSTRVVGLFLESVRSPDRFLSALDRAEAEGIPVVMLKVGRTEKSRRMAASHSGAIVGNHDVFEAAMRHHGVHLVDTLDELAATLQLLSLVRSAAPGGVASIHDSGGERELLVDLAADLDLPLAELSPPTVERIAPHLEPGLTAENPLDAWGSGKGAENTFRESAKAIMNDESVAVGLYVLDWRENYYLHEMHEKILTEVAGSTHKPLIGVSNYSLTVNSGLASRLADHRVPLLEGTLESLKAVGHLLARRIRRGRITPLDPEHPGAASYREQLQATAWRGESFGFSLLSDYGIAVPSHTDASTKQETVEAACAIGFPVCLKTAVAGVGHKTEVGGVVLNLTDREQVASAYESLCERLGPEVLVCEMIDGSSEWMVGIVSDIDFGPAVTIAPGGTLVELLNERIVLPTPFSAREAALELRKLRAARLLTGFRGSPPLAFDALCQAAARISRIAADLHPHIAEMDVNPILVSESGAVAVDVLIRERGQPEISEETPDARGRA